MPFTQKNKELSHKTMNIIKQGIPSCWPSKKRVLKLQCFDVVKTI